MKAYEFNSKIEAGTIKIPVDYLEEISQTNNVRVIILTEETTGDNKSEIDFLIENPLRVEKVNPLSREEIYER
ncbi:MAG: hypothetical protein QNJ37_24695 [Crocosphaera sp.]|nr:hypothetical protein [Crocosphaera sp.]